MDSLKRSFKNHGSYKAGMKPVGGQEELPILLDEEDAMESPGRQRKEMVVTIDGNSSRDVNLAVEPDNKIWKGRSYDFDQFQRKQDPSKTSIDLETMDEVPLDEKEKQHNNSKNVRVSFQCPSTHRIEICPETINDKGYPSSGKVLKCSSNAAFHHSSSLLRSKTRSRLIDPPPIIEDDLMKSNKTQLKSGQLKSGMLGKIEDEEEDPFLDEDLPVQFNENLSALTILQWISLIVILVVFICTLTIPFLTKLKIWNLILWKWEVLVLVLICGRLVSGWGIRILVFFIERNFLLRKRVLYFVYALRKAVQNCLWLGLVLIIWNCIFNETDKDEIKNKNLPYVTKILVCFMVATLIWLVKTLLVKVLASSFHVSTYFDRIQDSLFNQYVIETLSGPPLIEIQNIKEDEERMMTEVQRLQNSGAKIPADLIEAALPSKSFRTIASSKYQKGGVIGKSFRVSSGIAAKQDEGITIDHLHKLNQKNVSAWNMKRLMKIVRYGTLSTLDEHIPNMTGKDDSAVQIQSEYEAKAAAKKIFTNVAMRGSKYIYLVDLKRFMSDDEAVKAMGLFEGANESKRVNKTALKNWVVNAFRERRALSLTLNDTKTAVNKLHQMINILVGIIILVIWLLILGIATSQLLVVISSQLLLVAFIFGNTCKMIFEAIIFLFVMHPFDVGDRCEIEGVQMIVEEMNILTTVFLRYDNQKISYPNSLLSTKFISNYYRSPDMGDSIEFCVHVSTPVEKLSLMRERIKGCIEGKKEHWYPNPFIVITDVVDMNKLKFAIWPQHRMNHQNMGERWLRRSWLVEDLIKIFRDLNLEFRMLPVDVNLRNMAELTSSRLPSTWTTCA